MLLFPSIPADEDRRKQESITPGDYTQGIQRIVALTESTLDEHDSSWNGRDSTKWQSDYKLHDHSTVNARVMTSIGQARGRDDHLILLGSVSGLLHDVGKVHPSCVDYRANRVLTTEEKRRVDNHAGLSGDYVLESMAQVRPVDRLFLTDVHPIVRFHHRPWLIRDPELREIGFDVMLADIFVSRMENRHRPGLSQFQSVESLEAEVRKLMRDPRMVQFGLELQASLQTIVRLYGVDRKALSIG